MTQLVTPKQVAQAIGVSESSLKRWCDQGKLNTVRTAGGHRRLQLADVLAFLRQTGHEVVRPELLHLPSNTGQGASIVTRAREQLRDALLAGDEQVCRRIVFDLFLAHRALSEIFDQVIAAAFHEIGQRWSCGEAAVYQERRGCEICLHALAELRAVIPAGKPQAPLAIGGTPECDPYALPTAMVELVLRQAGWRSQSLGSRLPFSTLLEAIAQLRPAVFWLSVSHLDDPSRFLDEYQQFYTQVPADVAVVVGGQGLTDAIRRQMAFTAHCDNLQHFESLLKSLKRTIVPTRRDKSSAATTSRKRPPRTRGR